MRKLTPRQAEATALFASGKTHAEVGEAMGISRVSAKNAINRGRRERGLAPLPTYEHQRMYPWELNPRRCGRCSLLLDEYFLRAQDGHGEL
jgi:Sigma-70, region 4